MEPILVTDWEKIFALTFILFITVLASILIDISTVNLAQIFCLSTFSILTGFSLARWKSK